MLFENNNYDYDYDILNLSGFDMNNIKRFYENQSLEKIYDTKTGFLKGNMWKNEYVPYKNMKSKELKISSEQEALKIKIMELEFAINDFNLYLDLNPEDKEIYEQFQKNVIECIKLQNEYTKKYGPLLLSENKEKNYDWINGNWPWNKFGGNMYV